MGAGQSTEQQLSDQLLSRLSGSTSIPYDDPFWGDLLSCFKEPLISLEPAVVEDKLRPHCQQLLVCNPMSHNFQSLVLHTVSLLSEESTQDVRGRRTAANGVRLCAAVIKVAAETGNGSSLLERLFEMTPNLPIPKQLVEPGAHQLLRLLVRRCLLAMLQQPARGAGYVLLLELLHLLLLLVGSTQLGCQHVRGPPGSHPGIEALCSMTATAPQVVSLLLSLYVRRPLPPEDVQDLSQPRGVMQGGDSTLGAVASAASALLWLPATALGSVLSTVTGYTATPDPSHDTSDGHTVPASGGMSSGYPLSPSPLGDLALLLLLLLLHAPDQPPAFNPYMLALRGLQDAPPEQEEKERSSRGSGSGSGSKGKGQQGKKGAADKAEVDVEGAASASEPTLTASNQHHASTSFHDLNGALARALTAPAVVGPTGPVPDTTAWDTGVPGPPPPPLAWRLGSPSISTGAEEALGLLYVLLTANAAFKDYVMTCSDLPRLLVPLLRSLYLVQPSGQPHLLFMAQIVLLILSQDNKWAARIHKQVLHHGVGWCKEQMVKGVTLGSLVVVVLLRTISNCWSLNASSDLTTPANALAALANLSPYCTQLHARAAQRLMALLAALTRKYTRMGGVLGGPLPLSAALSGAVDAQPASVGAELSVVEDYLRILLEIINLCLTGPTDTGAAPGNEGLVRTGQIACNVELVYAILHQQEVVAGLQTHPRLGLLANNLHEGGSGVVHQQEVVAGLQTHPRLGLLANNLHEVIDFFNHRLDQASRVDTNLGPADSSSLPLHRPSPSLVQGSGSWSSADQVLRVLTSAMLEWRNDRIKTFPQLRFEFVEEEEPDAFFIPYVWSLVIQRCGSIVWDSQHVAFANLQQPPPAAVTDLGL